MSVRGKFLAVYYHIKDVVGSSRGKEVLLFLLFLGISYIFWLLLTLNNEMQEDLTVPLEMENVPDSVTIVSDIPPSLKVSVRDKGASLMRYKYGNPKVMKINWDQYKGGNDKIVLNRADLGARLRDYFGSSSQIVTVIPDSLKITYTSKPGRKVAIKVDADIRPALGYIISGPIKANVDSVWLYSVNDMPHSLTYVETIPIIRSGLTDTTKITAAIQGINNVRIIPPQVTLTVPVEPLISRKQIARIVVKNLPEELNLITFPSQIEVSYLVPMSSFNTEFYDINAYVDYQDVKKSKTGKIPVTLSLIPDLYYNTDMRPDSVEYIIESKQY